MHPSSLRLLGAARTSQPAAKRTAAADVFGVGTNGTIVHFDGVSWTAEPSGTSQLLRGIWGVAGDNMFTVGAEGTILHRDADGWSAMTSNTAVTLWDVWGSGSGDVFAVGEGGTILHHDGTGRSVMDSGTTADLYGARLNHPASGRTASSSERRIW